MTKRKILIVSRAFFPENSPRSFRTTELAKELARQGHEVTLIIPNKITEHSVFEQKHNLKIKDMGRLKFKPFKVRGKGIVRLFTRAMVRIPHLLFEYPDIQLVWMAKRALKNETGYDLLISIAVPHPIHWGVAWARTDKHRIAKVWVADCGDPYMGAILDSFKKRFYFKYCEKFFCSKADFISIPIEDGKKAYYSEYRDKIIVIPQGFKFEDTAKFLIEHKTNPIPTFAYAGSFIPGWRDIRPLLEFLLTTQLDFKFHIYTKNTGLIQPYLEKAQGKIMIHDYIPRSELLSVLSRMDFVVNIENGVKEHSPSKLIDYFLVERPVISLDSNNLDTVKIIEFLNGNYSRKLKTPDLDQYRIENVCQQFLQLLDDK